MWGHKLINILKSATICLLVLVLGEQSFAGDWLKRLEGAWEGPFESCVTRLGRQPQVFDTQARFQMKLQGRGLQGPLDFGAHGRAFFSYLTVLPDDEKTHQLTLESSDKTGQSVQTRLYAEYDDTVLSFRNATSDPKGYMVVEISIAGRPINEIDFQIRHNNPLAMEQFICGGRLFK